MSHTELFYDVLRRFSQNGLFNDTQIVVCSAVVKTGYSFTIKWRVLTGTEKLTLDMRRKKDRAQLYCYEYVTYKLSFGKENIFFTERRAFTKIEEKEVFSYQEIENLMNHVIDVVYYFI